MRCNRSPQAESQRSVQFRGLSVILLSLIGSHFCFAITRHVPGEYPTIQSALDAVQSGDTVLVALGIYAESLHAPMPSFVLKGDVVPDTGDYPRPIIDPSTLSDADSLSCMVIATDNSQVYEDLHFRNGPQMYPRRNEWYWGGGVFDTLGGDMTFRSCIFDSTFVGIWNRNGGGLDLDQCHFRHNVRSAVIANGFGPVSVTQCDFSGSTVDIPLLYTGNNSEIRQCIFHHSSIAEVLSAFSNGIVEDCIFQSNVQLLWSFIYFDGVRFARNLIVGNEIQGGAINANLQCEDSVVVEDNTFISNGAPNGNTAIQFLCYPCPDDTTPPGLLCGFYGIFENNVFQNNEGLGVKAIFADPFAVLLRNRFIALQPYDVPCIYIVYSGVQMRDNMFEELDFAVMADDSAYLDARLNWWGEDSGPFHASRNPQGRGAEVHGWLVDFDPWHTDTSFLSAPHSRAPIPQEVSLDVFPNPFNATATMKLYTNQPGIFQFDLFNLLGQRVQKIWSGPVAYEKTISFDGSYFPSGLYLVRVWQPIQNRPVALKKVVLTK